MNRVIVVRVLFDGAIKPTEKTFEDGSYHDHLDAVKSMQREYRMNFPTARILSITSWPKMKVEKTTFTEESK